MKVVDVKKVGYRDNLAKKRQRRFLARALSVALAALVVIAGLAYAIFFSSWFDIREISVDGLAEVRATPVREFVQQHSHNVLFINASGVEDQVLAKFTFIQEVNIKRNFFHGLTVHVTERQSDGIWCFTTSCSYYDHNGVLIAPAPRSSGFLTLTVNDMRSGVNTIDPKFLSAVKTITTGLVAQDIKVKDITIPAGTFTELEAMTGEGYPIRFSIETDLVAQLHALEIFNKQHPNPATPYQYIDLRFEGRVYYK